MTNGAGQHASPVQQKLTPEQQRQHEAEAKYKDYSDGEAKTYSANVATLDGQILTLSAGLLGVSLAFISDLVDLKTAKHLELLMFSWVLAGASVLVVLSGFRFATSLKTHDGKLKAARQAFGVGDFKGKPDLKEGKAQIDKIRYGVDKYNRWSFRLFVIALVSQMLFIAMNIL